MLVTMTVAVLFLSPGASSEGWTCALDIGKMRQCILREMVNFPKVNLPWINKCTFTLAKFEEDMQLKMLVTMTVAVLFAFLAVMAGHAPLTLGRHGNVYLEKWSTSKKLIYHSLIKNPLHWQSLKKKCDWKCLRQWQWLCFFSLLVLAVMARHVALTLGRQSNVY